MRLAKFIARAGYCSRRKAEIFIIAKKVLVNGKVIDNLATQIAKDDKVVIEKTLLPDLNELYTLPDTKPRLWALHKIKGTITSSKDPQNRPTVFDDLPNDLPRLISIGRLDYNTEGLLLLTNNGELARFLELPSNNFLREYRCRVFGRLLPEYIDEIENGMVIDGISYKKAKVIVDRQINNISWIRMILSEGKNREIKKILEYFDLEVTRLIRIGYGEFKLGSLRVGEIKEISQTRLSTYLSKLRDFNNYTKP